MSFKVDDSKRTWHNGEGTWGGYTNIVDVSIEIDIVNGGDEPFPSEQIQAVALLCRQMVVRYGLAPNKIIGHFDSAPTSDSNEAHDPSAYFDWKLFYLVLGIYPRLYASKLTDSEQRQVLLQSAAGIYNANVQIVQEKLRT